MHRGSTHILRQAFGDKLEDSTLDALRATAASRSYNTGAIICNNSGRG